MFVTLVVPGDLQTLTGGYAYDRRIVVGLRERGWTVNIVQLDGSFPHPTPAALAEAARALADLRDEAVVLVDGLAFGAMPDQVEREASRLRFVALVHHPLALETGLERETAAAFEERERRSLACARHVIVTSRATASTLARYGVPLDRLIIAEPGTVRLPASSPRPPASALPATSHQPPVTSFQPPATSHQSPRLLCVATLTARKGHEVLFRALAGLTHHDWSLRCIGGLDRDPALVERLRALSRAAGLEDRVEMVGELSGAALSAEYANAALFVLPTFYEGYGMAVAEALVHGVPVVSTPTGGIAELVGTDAGLLVPPGDVDALTAALDRFFSDASLRAHLIEGARVARDRLPTWDQAVDAIATALSAAGTAFSPDWLALREPADHAARSAAIVTTLATALSARPLRIVDLGAGTGANARYLSPRLPSPQQWLLVDHDVTLLARAAVVSRADCEIETRRADLATLKGSRYESRSRDESGSLAEPVARPFQDRDLITASALLDLVSEAWLRALAEQCAENRTAVLFALTYDGRIECAPEDPEDDLVRGLVNRHQRTDKGLGPALGPGATDEAARLFEEAGYTVTRAKSDWHLGPESAELQRQLITGWANAAAEIDPTHARTIESWRRRRIAHVDAGESRLTVGHEDLAARPKRENVKVKSEN